MSDIRTEIDGLLKKAVADRERVSHQIAALIAKETVFNSIIMNLEIAAAEAAEIEK